jgi:hypothetical protein
VFYSYFCVPKINLRVFAAKVVDTFGSSGILRPMTQDNILVSSQSSACLKPGSPLDPRPRPAEPGDTIDFRSNGSSHPTAPSYLEGHRSVAPAPGVLAATLNSQRSTLNSGAERPLNSRGLQKFPAHPNFFSAEKLDTLNSLNSQPSTLNFN